MTPTTFLLRIMFILKSEKNNQLYFGSTKPKSGGGFTLTELLVVTGIIILLSGIILPQYRIGERQFALQRSAYKLAQDLRRAQELSMSAKPFNCPSGKMKGYGINLAADQDFYLLKAKCEGGNDQTVEEIKLEKEVKIKELTSNPLNIFFYPPDPEIDLGDTTAQITLCLKVDSNQTKIVTINKAGLINVE